MLNRLHSVLGNLVLTKDRKGAFLGAAHCSHGALKNDMARFADHTN